MSPIQSILVHLDCGPHGAARLRVARALGGRFGASVCALYAVVPAYVDLSLVFTAGLPNAELLALDETRLAAARQLVTDANAEPGVQIEWREARDAPEREFLQQAFYADLLVLGQHARDRGRRDSGVAAEFVQWVVLGSGKPALVVPWMSGPTPPLRTVLVAWKASREAARALSAAMPLLHDAEAVHIALDADTTDAHRALLVRLLECHGVQAQIRTMACPAPQAGEALLSMAADVNADLLVMGCYGHSRGRELVLGGASRTVLQSMTLPVLLAH